MTAIIMCSETVQVLLDSYYFNDAMDTFYKEVYHIANCYTEDIINIICTMLSHRNMEVYNAFIVEFDDIVIGLL